MLLHSLSDKYPWERYEPPNPPSYRLNSTTTVLLEGWLWHQITYKGWCAIKQRNQEPINNYTFFDKNLIFLTACILFLEHFTIKIDIIRYNLLPNSTALKIGIQNSLKINILYRYLCSFNFGYKVSELLSLVINNT